MPLLLILLVIAGGLVFWLGRRQLRLRREAYIRHAVLPKGLFEKLMKRHPQLTRKDCQLVAQGLRQFFLAHLNSGLQFVSMPSQVTDDLWHEFILYTRHYEVFCQKAFGRFMHHTPAAVFSSDKAGNEGLRRCWWHACREENIDPRTPSRLPLLFALDAKLHVADGFVYQPDCSGVRRTDPGAQGGTTYCGGDFISDAYDGGTDGFGDGGSDSGGGGGGDGGGGCGGGCGGGGGD
ncbi:MAG: hypothetical protein RI907_252 [Pseudomonadota bacterium]|jgi:hypothetical protein